MEQHTLIGSNEILQRADLNRQTKMKIQKKKIGNESNGVNLFYNKKIHLVFVKNDNNLEHVSLYVKKLIN